MIIPDPPVSGETSDLIVWGLIVVVLGLLGSLTFIVKTYRRTEDVKNSMGEKDDLLIDKVSDMEENIDKLLVAHEAFASKGWLSLPSDLNSSAHLTETIREVQQQLRFLIDRSERIDQKIELHLAQHDKPDGRRR